MASGKVKINPGYSHLTENLEVPDFQYDIRLERRWRRRFISNEMIKHKYHANATRKSDKNCGNAAVKCTENIGHLVEEEVDEDYKFFLDNDVFHIDVECDNNVGGSDIDVNTSHDSNSDDDTDAEYKMFLENLREDGNSYIFEVLADSQFFQVKYEGQEGEKLHDSVNSEVQCDSVDEDFHLFLNPSRIECDNLVYMPERAINTNHGGSELEEKSSMSWKNLQIPNEATNSTNIRQGSDNFHVAKHKGKSEVFSDMVDEDYRLFLSSVIRQNSEEKGLRVGQNLQVPNEATKPPKIRQCSDDYHVAKHKSGSEVLSHIVDEDWGLLLNSMVRQNSEEKSSMNVDEDYQSFLNSYSGVGDSLKCTPKNGVTEVYKEENDLSSSDSELTILDPNQFCQNSPFICSKSYHSSLLAGETNHRDSMLASDPSPYRKGLMERLEKPYDQNEYDELFQKASYKRPKEHHRETRHGVVKSCPHIGVNKPHLEMYSDLAEAIDQVKKPHKVLFLLRGFYYWLEKISQKEAFRPWLDASCLEILDKM